MKKIIRAIWGSKLVSRERSVEKKNSFEEESRLSPGKTVLHKITLSVEPTMRQRVDLISFLLENQFYLIAVLTFVQIVDQPLSL